MRATIIVGIDNENNCIDQCLSMQYMDDVVIATDRDEERFRAINKIVREHYEQMLEEIKRELNSK